jgi:glyoxylase-like metal-dependent hydrolase (beta-lactamase superfamily II)
MKIQPVDSRITAFLLDEFRTSWLIRDEKNALIESGYPSNALDILNGLAEMGLALEDIHFIALTHIHVDHAGGAGYLARENPKIKVLVHEKGAHHLLDPSRLMESVRQAYGDRFETVGEVLRIAKDQILSVTNGDRINLGDTSLDVYYTPGHAKHHVVYHDRTSESVFAGDALGSKYPHLPNFVLTPPQDYDRDAAKQSIDLIQALNPKRINFTHLGPYTLDAAGQFFDELKSNHDRWNEGVCQIVHEEQTMDPETVFGKFLETQPELRNYPEQFFSFRLSIKGILIYLKRIGKI